MSGIYLIFCLAIIVFLGFVVLLIVFLKSGTQEQKGETPAVKTGKAEEVSPQIHLERSRELIKRYNAAEAKKHALAAFRGGDREIRSQAVKLLSALHEVEEF